jgi:cation diffusion facilitator CzcD-associated flavoprotein CzcO
LLDPKANREAYDFWARKTLARIDDPVKRDLLAPEDPPYYFGTKRPSLEQDYYEQFNKPTVHIFNVKENPIVEIRPHGIVTGDGKFHEVDTIAVATGFDTVTGGITSMGIKDVNGVR